MEGPPWPRSAKAPPPGFSAVGLPHSSGCLRAQAGVGPPAVYEQRLWAQKREGGRAGAPCALPGPRESRQQGLRARQGSCWLVRRPYGGPWSLRAAALGPGKAAAWAGGRAGVVQGFSESVCLFRKRVFHSILLSYLTSQYGDLHRNTPGAGRLCLVLCSPTLTRVGSHRVGAPRPYKQARPPQRRQPPRLGVLWGLGHGTPPQARPPAWGPPWSAGS